MDTVSYLLGKKNGGGSGTTNYNDLSNKPSINDVTLSGNKTLSDLGIQEELVSGTNIKTINSQSILGSGDITISGGGDDDFGKVYLFRGDAFNTSDTQLVKIYKQIKADFDNGITSTFINFSNSNLYNETTKYSTYGIYRVEKFNSTNNKLYLNSIDWRFNYEDTWSGQSYSLLQLRSPEIIITFDSNGDITAIASESNSLKTVSFLKTNGYGTSAFIPTAPGAPTSKKYVDDLPTTYTGYDATKTQVLKNVNGTLTWVDE